MLPKLRPQGEHGSSICEGCVALHCFADPRPPRSGGSSREILHQGSKHIHPLPRFKNSEDHSRFLFQAKLITSASLFTKFQTSSKTLQRSSVAFVASHYTSQSHPVPRAHEGPKCVWGLFERAPRPIIQKGSESLSPKS